MKIGNNQYKTILLDTNILREIILDNNGCRKGFFMKFFSSDVKYAPCFSIYNVIELKPYQDIYNSFIEFFSIIPCLMLFPYKNVLQAEYLAHMNNQAVSINNQIANAFTPARDDISYNIKNFLNKLWNESDLIPILEDEIRGLEDVAKAWNNQREEAKEMLSKLGITENIIDENYYRQVEKDTILKDIKVNGLAVTNNIDIAKFPGMRVAEYSQFNRVHQSKKLIKQNDVMDIKISYAIPYVDAVITENYQAEIYKKAKRLIKEIKDLEVYRLKDIRTN